MRRNSRPKRAYRACTACRLRKVRCNVGNPDQPRFPCQRCRRMGLRCVPADNRDEDEVHTPLDPGGRPSPRVTEEDSVTGSTRAPQVVSPGNARQSRRLGFNEAERPLFLEHQVHDSTDAFNALVKASTSASQLLAQDQYDETSAPFPSSPHAENVRINLNNHTEPSAAWKDCWLVKNNWLRAEEAAWYVDKFFESMGPMTPILLDFFSHPSNHEFLIFYEPLLCYTILTIASSAYSLPFPSTSPSHELIHTKCWEITKSLCQRVLWAQEVGSNSKLRTFGTVLALLLLAEWPPRMISLPPEEMADYIPDSTATSIVAPNRGGGTLEDEERHIRLANATRWMTELSQPIIRSDRISGMLLGIAEALAAELNITKHPPIHSNLTSESSKNIRNDLLQRYRDRRARVRLLLYLHTTQSNTTIGSKLQNLMSPNNDITVIQELSERTKQTEAQPLQALVSLAKLSQITNDAKKILFQSTEHSGDLIERGEHLMWLKHFRDLLKDWLADTERLHLSSPIREIVEIEYQALRIRLCSLCVEALSKRIFPSTRTQSAEVAVSEYLMQAQSDFNSQIESLDDYSYVQEAASGSKALLFSIIRLGEQDRLKYAPLRIFTRIVFAVTVLLKSTYLHPVKSEIEDSLAVVRSAKRSLMKSIGNDRMHVAYGITRLISLHQGQLTALAEAYQGSMVDQQTHNSAVIDDSQQQVHLHAPADESRQNMGMSPSSDQYRDLDLAGFTEQPILLPHDWYDTSFESTVLHGLVPWGSNDGVYLDEFTYNL